MAEASLDSFLKIVARTIGLNSVRTVFELGARDGAETIAFAKQFPWANIFAFECNPATLGQCREAIKGLQNVSLVEKAVCDRDGEIPFYPINPAFTITTWKDGNPGASSIYKASSKYPVEQYVQDEIRVPATTLESFIDEHHVPPIDLLWMDIQGAELLALKGMGSHLQGVRLIHSEVEFLEIYQGQPLFREVKRYLNRHSFRLIEFTHLERYSADAVFINVSEGRALRDRVSFFLRDRFLCMWRRNLPVLTNRGPIGLIRGIYRGTFVCPGCRHRFLRGFSLIWHKKFLPLFAGVTKGRSDQELDVIIPAVEKDLTTLPHTIDGVRQNLLHPIKRIFVVAPESPKIRKVCKALNVVFVNEENVAPIARQDIDYVVRGKDRSGWLLQQLIKLNGDSIATTDNFLILDADTVLIKPQRLEIGGRCVFFVSDEHHHPYYVTYEKLLGKSPRSLLSFVCHYMMFNRQTLTLLRKTIEDRSHKSWASAIVDAIDKDQTSGFSEYETYGNFVYGTSPAKVARRYSNNRTLGAESVSDLARYTSKSGRFMSLSFHVYEG